MMKLYISLQNTINSQKNNEKIIKKLYLYLYLYLYLTNIN